MAFDAGSITATAVLDRAGFLAGLDELKRKVEDFAAHRFEVTVGINRELSSGLAIAEQRLRDFAAHRYDVTLGVDRNLSGIELARQQLDSLPDRVDVLISVRGASEAVVARVERLSRALRDLPREETTTIRVNGADQADEAGTNALFAARGLNALIIAGVSLAPALVPVSGALLGVAGALSAVGSAAALGLGGLAIVAKENAKELKSQAAVVTEAAAQMGQAFGPQLLAITGPALSSVAGLVRQLSPATEAALGAVGKLAAQFERSANGGGVSQFIAELSKLTGPAISGLGRILGNTATGVGHFVEAFAPLSTVVVGGIERATAALAKFNFGPLVAYARQEIPALGQLLQDLGAVVVSVVRDVAPLGSSILVAVHGLAEGLQGTLPGLRDFATAVAAPAVRGLAPLLHAAGDAVGSLAEGLSHLGGFLSPAVTEVLALAVAIKGIGLAVAAGKGIASAFTGLQVGIRAARQEMALLSYSSSAARSVIGRIGSAALSGGGLAVVSVAAAAAAVGIGLLIKHYEDGKPKVDSFSAALAASNNQLTEGVRQQAALNLQQNGALDAARSLGIGLSLVTSAALHQTNGLDAVNAAGRRVTAAYLGLAAANQKAAAAGESEADIQKHSAAVTAQYDAYNKLVGVLGLNQGELAKDSRAQANIAAATATTTGRLQEYGLAQQLANAAAGRLAPIQANLTAATKAYNAAMTNLSTTLSAIVNHFQGVQGAEDQLATDINNLTASVKTNGDTFAGNSVKALANRAAIRQLGGDYASLVTAVAQSNEPLAQQKQQLDASRVAALANAKALGLPADAVHHLAAELQALENHNPNFTFTAKITGDKQTIAQITDLYNSVKHVPTTANVAFVAQGVRERLADAADVTRSYNGVPTQVSTTFGAQSVAQTLANIKSVTITEGQVPTSIFVGVSTDAAGVTEALQRLLYAAQQAKNELELGRLPGGGVGASVASSGGGLFGTSIVQGVAVGISRGAIALNSLVGTIFQTLGRYVQFSLTKGLTGSASSIQSTMSTLIGHVESAFNSLASQKSSTAKSIDTYKARLQTLNDQLGAAGKVTAAQVAKLNEELAGLNPKSKDFAARSADIKAQIKDLTDNGSARTQALLKEIDKITAAGGPLAKAQEKLRQLGQVSGSTEAPLLALIRKDNSVLQGLANARDKIAAQLSAKTTVLHDLQAKSASYASSLAQSLTPSLFNSNGDGPVSAGDAIGSLKLNLQQLLQFQRDLTELRKRGVAPSIVAQIAQAGIQQGLPAAAALLSGSNAQLRQINALQTQINLAAGNIGTTTANSLYGGAIAATQHLVAELTSQEDKVVNAMAKLAASLERAIEKALKLGTPASKPGVPKGPIAVPPGGSLHVTPGPPPVHNFTVVVEMDGKQFDARIKGVSVKTLHDSIVSAKREGYSLTRR